MHNKVFFIGAVGYTIALAILSLISTDDVPKISIDISDKLLHVIAYALLAAVWYIALNTKFKQINLIWLALGCIFYGIVLEAIQGELDTQRTTDFYDVLANTVGVALVVIPLFFKKKQQVKNT